jgi:indole-3-glycerol phosphate synthase
MSLLEKILDRKRAEIAALNARSLRRAAASSPAPRDFSAAIQRRRIGPRPGLIAELKRASPSRGILAAGLDLFRAAELFAENGAAAISVLTDGEFFMGSLETLRELRFGRKSSLPLLRKDFILDEAQLYESRANGADAVLLIAAALTDDRLLADLHAAALGLGLAALVEVHDEAEAERALALKEVNLIGINNRDLGSFAVALETTERIRPLIPAGIAVVSESGIFGGADLERLSRARVDAVLVGEALMIAEDIGAKVRELSGVRVPSPAGGGPG